MHKVRVRGKEGELRDFKKRSSADDVKGYTRNIYHLRCASQQQQEQQPTKKKKQANKPTNKQTCNFCSAFLHAREEACSPRLRQAQDMDNIRRTEE